MDKQNTGFLLFERWHNKPDGSIGSSRIRGWWIVNHWDEAEIFRQGKKYDAIVMQKCYWPSYMRAFDGKVILDLCDADWLYGQEVKESIDEADAITCSTDAMTEYIKKLAGKNKPVITIPDRHDLSVFKNRTKKQHEGRAKRVCWFGYGHNNPVLDLALPSIKKHELKLTVISDMRPPYNKADENIKWTPEGHLDEIQKCDFVIMPTKKDGRFKFKSNNKTITSWALGMPVATGSEDLKRFIDPEERQKEADKRYQEVLDYWDVKLSVDDFKKLIGEL